jgi:hypothetical protein
MGNFRDLVKAGCFVFTLLASQLCAKDAMAANYSAAPGDLVQVREGDKLSVKYSKQGRIQVTVGSYDEESAKVTFMISSTNKSGTRERSSVSLGSSDSGFLVEVLKASPTSSLVSVPKSLHLD